MVRGNEAEVYLLRLPPVHCPGKEVGGWQSIRVINAESPDLISAIGRSAFRSKTGGGRIGSTENTVPIALLAIMGRAALPGSRRQPAMSAMLRVEDEAR